MNKAKKIIYAALFVVFAAVFIVSAVIVGRYIIDAKQQAGIYDDISNRVNSVQNSTTEPTATITTPFTDPDSHEPGTILPEYADLFLENPDMVGWISIPGTEVDYPVMQTPYSPDFYLRRNFYKESNSHGAIYVREVCDVNEPSDNITIYGHNMHDGSMFAAVTKYQHKDFWEEHKTFTFDTLTEHHTYEVVCAFKTSGNSGEGFAYHLFVDAENEEDFNEFISTCKALDFFETGVTAEYGDKLICLSTCEYTLDNGRLVVVAKRVS